MNTKEVSDIIADYYPPKSRFYPYEKIFSKIIYLLDNNISLEEFSKIKKELICIK